jgi:hypothetical protein
VAGVYAMVVLSFWSRVVKRESVSFCLFIDGLYNGPAVTRTVLCDGGASNEYQRLRKEVAVT